MQDQTKTRRGRWLPAMAVLFAAITLAIAGGVFIGVNPIAVGQSGDKPITPTPPTGRPSTSTAPPVRARADFLVTPRELSGRVVQWRQTSRVFDLNGPDPANGRTIVGDIWVQIGQDGVPTRFHGIYRYEDGSFRQEILQTPTEEVVTFENAMAVRLPTGERVCTQRGASTPDRLRGVGPSFVNTAALQRAGYRPAGTGRAASGLPVTAALPGVASERVFESPATAQNWTSDGRSIQIAPDGRMVAVSSRQANQQGQVLAEEETTFGPLFAYRASSVPNTVFTLTREGCGD